MVKSTHQFQPFNDMILAFSEVDMEFKMAQSLLAQLKDGSAKFADVLAFIEARYQHTPTAFQKGAQFNAATEKQGRAKVLTFAKRENATSPLLQKESVTSPSLDHVDSSLVSFLLLCRRGSILGRGRQAA